MTKIKNCCKKIWVLFIAILCICSFSEVVSAEEYEGLDVSVWQGTVDFMEVKSDGKQIVYIRAGYGLSEDTMFRTNSKNARDAGMRMGFYFYVTAQDVSEAKAQAEYFASLISNEPYDCRPAVDFEIFTGLTDEECIEIALAFSETLANKTGETPLFYTDVDHVEYLWGDRLTDYPLWVANYDVSEPESVGAWNSWVGFQYSDTGNVNGIDGNVDLDRFTSDVLLESSDTELPFIDVAQDNWYYKAVASLYDAGLVKGVSNTVFAPDEDAERAVPVTILYRLDGSPNVSSEFVFADVSSDSWYADSIAWAADNDIAKGIGGDLFAPDKGVSRQEMAVFLYRYAVYKDYDTTKTDSMERFTDYDLVADWAEEAIKWAVGMGIITGTRSDMLAPDAAATRAEVAEMIYRMMEAY